MVSESDVALRGSSLGALVHLKKVINYLPENIELVFVSLETVSVV